jgi:hypothetical protein
VTVFWTKTVEGATNGLAEGAADIEGDAVIVGLAEGAAEIEGVAVTVGLADGLAEIECIAFVEVVSQQAEAQEALVSAHGKSPQLAENSREPHDNPP